MASIAAEPPLLRLVMGGNRPGAWEAGLPVLAGERLENLFPTARPAGREGEFSLFQQEDWTLGLASIPVTAAELEAVTFRQYLEIFRTVAGLNLARIWHYVPAINEPGPAGIENYQAFCRGRALAFERQYGAGFKAFVPSASAVGSKVCRLTIVFAACRAEPRHVENPLQVPAYDYPEEHGPRPPSFARATIVPAARSTTVFVSGTAAIRGHATVAPHRTPEQVACALENLREISLACGLGPDLAVGPGGARHFKVYLRHATDQPVVAAQLDEHLLRSGDAVSYLHADICRAALNVEIEATLRGPAAVGS